MSPIAKALFYIFSEGSLYRGEQLAQQFSVTRQAIWKAVNELKQYGLVETVGKQGYRANFDYIPLSKEKILSLLDAKSIALLNFLDVELITGSTNVLIADREINDAGVCVCEMQEAGKGRNGKTWISPFAKNLYFSMKIHFHHQALANLTSFSPALGLSVVKYLNTLGVNATIKWPNDIWVKGHKMAGILIETIAKQENDVEMIIGIGLNNHKVDDLNLSGNKVTSIEEELGQAIDRNVLIAALITMILELRDQYDTFNIPNLDEDWKQYSALAGQKIRLFSPYQEIIGEEIGIAENGALLIKDEAGKINSYFSGELSLRPYA